MPKAAQLINISFPEKEPDCNFKKIAQFSLKNTTSRYLVFSHAV